MKVFTIFFLIFVLTRNVENYKILGVFPMVSKSHYILGSGLMRGLAEKGHDVTVISPFGEKTKPKHGTYRDILLTGFVEKSQERQFNLFDMFRMNPIIYQLMMNGMGNMITELTLNHTNVQKLIHSNEQFDAVIVEQFVNDAHKGFAAHFKCPLIVFSTFASNAWVNPLVSNSAPPSFVPEQAIDFDHLNFFHRLKNVLIYILGEVNRNLLFFPAQDKILKQYFPGNLDLYKILYNTSLVLVNSHLSTNQAVPRVPSMIDIGGFHLKPAGKLPDDLQKYLDSAKEGVIYFSMGSGLKSAQFPSETRDAFLNAFRKLKLNVLWKWEDDNLPGQPANVKIGKWLPQQDILAHPNVKLFITHGGLLSLTETIYHGKPVLAIPIFGDQKSNAEMAARNGYGRLLHYEDVSETILTENINELLKNPRYLENVQRRSAIMHDRLASPIDEADFWISYVIRHKGAPHLRVLGLDLKWYQYLSLDIIAFLGLILVIFSVLSIVFIRKLLSRFCKCQNVKVKKS